MYGEVKYSTPCPGEAMSDPHAQILRRACDACAIRRGSLFLIVSSAARHVEVPDWVRCALDMGEGVVVYLSDRDAPPFGVSVQRDEVRVHRTRDGVCVRRDGVGRSIVIGVTPAYGSVALGNDARWLSALRQEQPGVHARRELASELGLDRHDTGEHDFVRGLWRLLPGHEITIGGGRRGAQRSWWAEEVRQWHDRVGHEESVEAFFEVLDEGLAIEDGFGLAVSSGLDSTLLAARCHAQRRHFTMGTMSFPGLAACDERERVREWVDTMGRLDATYFDMTEVSLWGDPSEDHLEWLGPQGHPGERYEREFVRRFAAHNDLSTIMTGVGADQLFDINVWDVIEELARRGLWEECMAPHWRDVLGEWGVLNAARHVWGKAIWRDRAPASWREARLCAQLGGMQWDQERATLVEEVIASMVAPRDEVWGASDDRVTRRRLLKSWAWEGVMRVLWRLERHTGVNIHTPYLEEAVWRWGVWLSPSERLNGFSGRLFNKFLLRKAHARHAEQFPRGFARRGKAAVFDEHIRRGMMQDVQLSACLAHIKAPLRREHARQLLGRVEGGEVGRPLVELCQIYARQRWRQHIEG